MKIYTFIFICLFDLLSSVVSAQGTFQYQSGQILQLPESITVQADDGHILSYRVPSTLKFAAVVNLTSFRFTPTARPPRCGAYLGQLYEAFKARVQGDDGQEFFAVAQPSSQELKVSVYGICQVGSSQLDHIQIEVKR